MGEKSCVIGLLVMSLIYVNRDLKTLESYQGALELGVIKYSAVWCGVP